MPNEELNLESLEKYLVENTNTQGIPDGVNFELTTNNAIDNQWFIPIPDIYPDSKAYTSRSALGAAIFRGDYNWSLLVLRISIHLTIPNSTFGLKLILPLNLSRSIGIKSCVHLQEISAG